MIAPLSEHDCYPTGGKRQVWLGPPGTGKTTKAIDMAITPALESGVPPSLIRAVTFSRAGASTLAERLEPLRSRLRIGGRQLEGMTSTIHSIALSMVRAVMPPDTTPLIGATDLRWQPAQTAAADEVPPQRLPDRVEMTDEQERVAALWDLARNLLIRDASADALARLVRERAPNLPLGRVRSLIADYEQRKQAVGGMDYCDLLIRTLDLTPPSLSLLIVDEAQDSSPLQWALLDRIIDMSEQVVLIGDLDQSVYTWAGASPDELLSRVRSGAWAVRRLAQSHRVPAAAHQLAVRLIRRNRDRVDAAYQPAPHDGIVNEATFAMAIGAIDAAAQVGRDVLVLARRARDLDRWGAELDRRAVPYLHERGACPLGSPLDVRRARAVHALREGQRVRRADALLLLSGLDPALLAESRTRVVERVSGDMPLSMMRGSVPQRDKTPRLHLDQQWVEVSDLTRVGVRADLLAGVTVREALRLAGLPRLRADGLARLVERHGAGVLITHSARHVRDHEREDLPDVHVRLTTCHAAKGREASLVVLDLRAPRLVVREIAIDRATAEAERRVLYVALTRVRDELVLVRPARHDLGQLLGLARTANRSATT